MAMGSKISTAEVFKFAIDITMFRNSELTGHQNSKILDGLSCAYTDRGVMSWLYATWPIALSFIAIVILLFAGTKKRTVSYTIIAAMFVYMFVGAIITSLEEIEKSTSIKNNFLEKIRNSMVSFVVDNINSFRTKYPFFSEALYLVGALVIGFLSSFAFTVVLIVAALFCGYSITDYIVALFKIQKMEFGLRLASIFLVAILSYWALHRTLNSAFSLIFSATGAILVLDYILLFSKKYETIGLFRNLLMRFDTKMLKWYCLLIPVFAGIIATSIFWQKMSWKRGRSEKRAVYYSAKQSSW